MTIDDDRMKADRPILSPERVPYNYQHHSGQTFHLIYIYIFTNTVWPVFW